VAAHCLALPDELSATEAAALPEAVFTVFVNAFELGRLSFGESLLVHGGASGIGTTAIRMAKAFGAQVAVTASGASRTAACRALGADLAIDYQTEDFVSCVREWTGGRGVDVILDMVGGAYLSRNLDALADEGRLAQIAILGGARGEVNLLKVMQKRLTITGSTLRSRDDGFKARVCHAVSRLVWPHVEAGRIRPAIHATFPLAEAARAHEALEAGGHVGKLVLLVE
jgi:NADPH2:quinone reductase